MGRTYLVVEGHGETKAALNFLTRLSLDLGLALPPWSEPIRGKVLHQERGIRKVCDLVRYRGDADALLILRDEDDGCPAEVAPLEAEWLRAAGLPFPAALLLAHREYEAFFLPSIHLMAGKTLRDERGVERAGIEEGTSFEGAPQAVRGVKEWLTRHMPGGRAYKPTIDQLPLTRMIDFAAIRQASPPLPCFGSLERSLQFLAAQVRVGATGVYP